jgi:tetratricopeptide (TPR) repeat protein
VYYPPPVVVVVNNNFAGGALPGNPIADAASVPAAVVPAVARNAGPPGQFIMITPKPAALNAANPQIPNGTTSPMLTQVMPPQLPPLPKFDPLANNNATNVEKPEKDPDREYARLMKLAGETFAGEEYGRCIRVLERAVAAKPAEALPHFLKAQCLFATGQYGEAVEAIREGMKLAPDWPTAAFRPLDYYGPSPQLFGAHLATLRKALAENPGEPLLQFLLGYELWFNGDHAEAAGLFRAAARGAKGNALIGYFVKIADRPVPR